MPFIEKLAIEVITTAAGFSLRQLIRKVNCVSRNSRLVRSKKNLLVDKTKVKKTVQLEATK